MYTSSNIVGAKWYSWDQARWQDIKCQESKNMEVESQHEEVYMIECQNIQVSINLVMKYKSIMAQTHMQTILANSCITFNIYRKS